MQTENKKGFQVKDLIVTALLSLCALVIYIGNCLIENAGVFHQRDFRYVTANRKSYLQENGQAAEKIKNI